MRLVATEYTSLDGIFEEPGHWSSPFFNEEAAAFKWEELRAADALLLGRRTYDGFAAAWPAMEGTGEFGVRMNSLPKHVVTSQAGELAWSGAERLPGDPVAAVARLKERPGNDLLLAGSRQLFTTLARAALIDRYRLLVFPVILGEGRRLFDQVEGRQDLKLVELRRFATGVLALEYEPAR